MLRIYCMFKAQYLKTAMEYTFNFWMMAIAGVIMRFLMMAVAFVLFRNVPSIAGWSEGEVYLIMAFMFISEGLCNLLFDGIWYIPRMVFTGEFDVILSRPVSPLFQVLSHEVALQGVGVLALGIISLAMSLIRLGWMNPVSILLCLPFIACGTVVRMSTYIIGACNVFWLGAGGQANIPYLLYSVGEYAKYPVSVYPAWMRLVLFLIIPFGMIGYVPALLLRGEQILFNALMLVCVTVLYFLLARAVFYRGIRRYESAGM